MEEEKRESRPGQSRRLRAWTRVDDYLVALARRRTERRRREPKPRTQPENPRAGLSTLPFLALILALAVLASAIVVTAWPGRERPPPKPRPASAEPGTAPPGWFKGR